MFLRYLFACDLSFTFCDFDTMAFLIISTVVTHRRLMVISKLTCGDAWSRDRAILQISHGHVTMRYLQYRTVDRRHVQHSIMMNVT